MLTLILSAFMAACCLATIDCKTNSNVLYVRQPMGEHEGSFIFILSRDNPETKFLEDGWFFFDIGLSPEEDSRLKAGGDVTVEWRDAHLR